MMHLNFVDSDGRDISRRGPLAPSRPGERATPGSLRSPHSAPGIQKLLEQSHRRTYPAKTAIIRQGDPSYDLYYIVKGSVTVLIEDEQGHELILAYLNPGEFFGELGLFQDEPSRSAQVRTRSQCEVAQIGFDKMRALTLATPELTLAIATQLANRLRKMNLKMGDLAFTDVSGRIARAVLDLCHEPDAMTHPDGMQIRVTRQELGRIVGCSREMVGRVLKNLEDQHLLSVSGKTIVVFGVR
jgi:CRP/FNR family cyclic AMP-dependent transcriptional regulator